MADDLLKNLGSKLIGWLLGIIGTVMIAGMWGGFQFYSEWKADKAAQKIERLQEKAIMFDSPEQKENIKSHVKEALTPTEQHVKLERDIDFQKKILNQLKQMQKIDTLNADQVFQTKDEIREIKKAIKNLKN